MFAFKVKIIVAGIILLLITLSGNFYMPTTNTISYTLFVVGTALIIYLDYKEKRKRWGLIISLIIGFFFVFFLQKIDWFEEINSRILSSLFVGGLPACLLYLMNRLAFSLP